MKLYYFCYEYPDCHEHLKLIFRCEYFPFGLNQSMNKAHSFVNLPSADTKDVSAN